MRFKLMTLGVLCAFAFVSCQKDPKPNEETIQILKEKEKITVSTDGATFKGEFAYSGVIDSMWLRVGTEEHLYGSDDFLMTLVGKTYSVEVTGLQPGTFYYYAYLADYGSTTKWQSELYGFTTAEEEIDLPTVATVEVTGVTVSTASCLCHVAADGGAEVTERGACWSTHQQPDISDFVFAHGQGLGDYSISMVDLEPNTTYYVRAYAKNRKGINYGEELSFTTLDYLDPPLGAVNGLFSVADDRQVWFSSGNLQYHASSNTWQFAEEQYEYIGDDNANIAEDYDGWIDLFGWGTSGYPHGAVCYQPWSVETNPDYYWAYGGEDYRLFDQSRKADWGYNIIKEDCQAGDWRTLTIGEWDYLLHIRNTSSGMRFVKAQVNDINGLILLPDQWSGSVYNLNHANQVEASFTGNIISIIVWRRLKEFGAVFLPLAGRRRGETTIEYAGSKGYYYSSECGGRFGFSILIDHDYIGEQTISRNVGASVRLVRDVERR